MKKIITSLCASLFLMNIAFSQVTISGTIKTEIGDPLKGATVQASGTANVSTTTDDNGFYSFSLPVNGSYTISPYKNDDPLNGVSTYDRVLIEQHILGVTTLNTPYKIIAADFNKSNTITTQDVVELYDLITFVITGFPNNTSWRFVDSSYVFSNPLNPFEAPFPEVMVLNNVTSDILDLNFIAIKTGDVNHSAVTSGNSNSNALGGIVGHVFFDENANCQKESTEITLGGWNITATDSLGATYYGTTNYLGQYFITAPQGTYTVKGFEPNVLWEPCVDSVPGVVITAQNVVTQDFGATPTDTCPNMEVNLSTTFLRRCFQNAYVVNYCNQGTADATGTYIEVMLDTFFTDVTASIPISSVNGHTYTFDIGDVPIGDCGNFYIYFTIDCNAVLGQTHCSSAYIFPEPPCTPVNPMWAGGDLEIIGECTGTDVTFTAINHGDDMTEPVEFIVIEDIMIQMTGGTIQLNNGQSQVVYTKQANGSTWRLLANEVGYHPFETIATAVVEGCGLNGNGTFSLGFVNQYPLSDEEPFEDEDCQENIGAYDPNDKTGYPIGYDEEHFISKGQDISYRIRFQNTGSDTAFNITVLDTLPSTLDPASLRVQGYSHPMEFELVGEGVAKFTFKNIMLPDSNVNEPLSHGFIKFNISQKPGLDLGTVIENEAAIYFDFNEPVITNRTLHTLGERLLEVASTEVFVPNLSINVFPNPFESEATFKLDGVDLQNGELHLFNVQGNLVAKNRFSGDTFLFNGGHLPEGLYFFQITDSGVHIANGKILVK